MAGDITALAFMHARIPLIDYHGTDANDQKHAQDRTTLVIKRWAALVGELQATRRKTLECCEARPGKGDAAVLAIVDREKFDVLHNSIATITEQIVTFEESIRKLDEIIANNNLSPGWLEELKYRLTSAGSGIYQQKTNITKLLAFHTQKNPRMSPEDVLKIPEFAEKRANADRLIKLDEDYLERMKPVVAEIEAVLDGAGC
jgi:hypothetical protein